MGAHILVSKWLIHKEVVVAVKPKYKTGTGAFQRTTLNSSGQKSVLQL